MAEFSLDDFFIAHHGCDDLARRREHEAWLRRYFRPALQYPSRRVPPSPIEMTIDAVVEAQARIKARARIGTVRSPWQILTSISKPGLPTVRSIIAIVMTDEEKYGRLLKLHFSTCEPANAHEQVIKDFVFVDPSIFQPFAHPAGRILSQYIWEFNKITKWLTENAAQLEQEHASHV